MQDLLLCLVSMQLLVTPRPPGLLLHLLHRYLLPRLHLLYLLPWLKLLLLELLSPVLLRRRGWVTLKLLLGHLALELTLLGHLSLKLLGLSLELLPLKLGLLLVLLWVHPWGHVLPAAQSGQQGQNSRTTLDQHHTLRIVCQDL